MSTQRKSSAKRASRAGQAAATNPSATRAFFQIKIVLDRIDPPIWRRVQLFDCTLDVLHAVVQTVLGWQNSHLHVFEVGDDEYGPVDGEFAVDWEDEAEVALSDLLARGVRKFRYRYDFGDDWDHTIQIERAPAADSRLKYPRCIDGARSGPLEDVGGPWGYMDLLDAMHDPTHERHDEFREWVSPRFNPESFSAERANRDLGKLLRPYLVSLPGHEAGPLVFPLSGPEEDCEEDCGDAG